MNDIKVGESKFYIGNSEDQSLAEIHFILGRQNDMIVDHTYVSDELRGRGTGTRLVEEIVQYARKENKRIIPLCPFVEEQIESNEQWHDVLN